MPVIAYILLFAAYRVLFLRIGYFEWYGVPAAAALILVAGVGLDRTCRWVSTASRGRFSPAIIAAVPAVLLALVYVTALPFRTVVEARVQHDVEDKVRDPLGRYLGEVVKPGETITSESSGYVGYYTNATLYDFPGLESPRVVSILQKARDGDLQVHSLLSLAAVLHSDWLVLRPGEAPAPAGTSPEAAASVHRGPAIQRSRWSGTDLLSRLRRSTTSTATSSSIAASPSETANAGNGSASRTKTPSPSRPAPPPPADNVLGRTWSRAWAYTRANPMLVGFIVVGLIARIAFWAITDRKLDDALITIKFDKNLADGFGLVHNLGEGHVQGFTSALSVLVPLPGELIYHGGGFLFIRLASLAFFVIAAVYAYRIAAELGVGRWPTALVLAYLALDQNQVFFGMAGMETQIAVGVLLASVYYVLVEDYPKSGVTLGLALLARPDFVLWVGPAYLFLIIRNWRASLRAGALSAAVVAPWLIFTTIYYGSPIPNTITAKNLSFGPDFPSVTHPGAWINFLGDQLSANAHAWQHFAPFYEAHFHRPLSDLPTGSPRA